MVCIPTRFFTSRDAKFLFSKILTTYQTDHSKSNELIHTEKYNTAVYRVVQNPLTHLKQVRTKFLRRGVLLPKNERAFPLHSS